MSSTKAIAYSKQIKSPSTILEFIKDCRGIADDMEGMVAKTSEADRALAAADIMDKWGVL